MKNNQGVKPDFAELPRNVGYRVHYESESSGCITPEGHDGDYCRCSVITNTSVPVNVNNAYNLASLSAKNNKLHNDLRFYCLERMLSCLIRENPNCFEVGVCNGYYGQETTGVTIDSGVVNLINNFIRDLNKGQSKIHYRNLVESTLRAEYGYVLPAIEGKDWDISKVSVKDIKPSHDSYRGSNAGAIAQYADRYMSESNGLLSCLCKKVNDTYTLIDGYHRYAAAQRRGDKYMLVVWCEA